MSNLVSDEGCCMADPASVQASIDDLHNTVEEIKGLLEDLLLETKKQTAVFELANTRNRRTSSVARRDSQS